MLLIALLVLVFFVAYVALNGGEHKLYRPGIARPLTIVLIVLVAWFAWPLYGHYIAWILPGGR
jgi:hypothetical protein